MLTRAQIPGVLLFVLLWLSGLLLCALFNWEIGPLDGSVEIPATTAVLRGLPWISVETVVLYAILRPATFRWSWGRLVGALTVLLPLAALAILAIWRPSFPGSSGLAVANALWILGVTAILLVILAISLIRPLVGNKPAHQRDT